MSRLRRLEREDLDVPSLEQRAANLLGAFALAAHDGLEEFLRAGRRPTSLSSAAALHIIRQLPGIQPVQLRLALGITHSACVRVVNRLQRSGFIARCRDSDDARATRLQVTPDGDRQARAFAADRNTFTGALVKHVPAYWLPRVVRVLELLLSVMTPDARRALRACRHCDWSICRIDPGAPCPVLKTAILRQATAEAEEARTREIPWWYEAIPQDERPPPPPLVIRPREPSSDQAEAARLIAAALEESSPRRRRRRWR